LIVKYSWKNEKPGAKFRGPEGNVKLIFPLRTSMERILQKFVDEAGR